MFPRDTYLCSFQADIVAQSKIIFHEKELLQLIHDHLINQGKFYNIIIYNIIVKLIVLDKQKVWILFLW